MSGEVDQGIEPWTGLRSLMAGSADGGLLSP